MPNGANSVWLGSLGVFDRRIAEKNLYFFCTDENSWFFVFGGTSLGFPALKMHINGKTVWDGIFTRSLGRMGKLASLGKKWIEIRSIAKYPHSMGVCRTFCLSFEFSFQSFSFLDLYGGRIDVRFANTSGSQIKNAKSQRKVCQTGMGEANASSRSS